MEADRSCSFVFRDLFLAAAMRACHTVIQQQHHLSIRRSVGLLVCPIVSYNFSCFCSMYILGSSVDL